MINLLPIQTKQQIRAARQNVVLRRYCFLLIFAAALIGGVFGAGFWLTANEKLQAEQAKTSTDQALAQYADVRKVANSFANDLTAAKKILGSGVSFSSLLIDIASSVPKGVVLNNLTLGESSENTPIDITGAAKSYAAAISLKNSLEKSDIFEDVSLTSVTQSEQGGGYPFAVTIKAQFTKSGVAK